MIFSGNILGSLEAATKNDELKKKTAKDQYPWRFFDWRIRRISQKALL